MDGIGVLFMKRSTLQSGRQLTAWCVSPLVVLCAVLAGCDVGPKYVPPVATAPEVYKESPTQIEEAGEWTVAKPQDAALRGKWWEIYNDQDLNALEDQLDIDNQNIRQAFENFMEARALVREARSQYFPTVGVGGSYTLSQTSSNVGSASSNVGSSSSTGAPGGKQSQVFAFPADVSWEPDLWGRVRNTVHASQYTAQLTAADLENERLTEQASLAEYFFEIRGQDALQQILDDTVEADKKGLDSEQARYNNGVDDQISLVEAQTTLETAQSAAINNKIARAKYEHAIATLIGKPASTFSVPFVPRTSAPPPIPVGLPSQLLERRPDIAAAERNMAAANAQIRVADAAYYPTLTLSATGGVESSAIKHILDWPSRFWSVGPSISETVYDGGLRRATVNQYIATYYANVATYRQSVLTAFQQVEDSLAEVRILSEQIGRQQEAVDSSQKFLRLELGRYRSGIDPYLDVVIAQTTLLGNQQALTNLQVQEMAASVQLIESLGGGWDRSQLPTPAQVSEKPSKSETAIQH
jgi:NodT family efflux transporter outer membrane factor (OMF) lipoprotein